VKLPWVFLGLLAIILISCGGVVTPTPPPRGNPPPPAQGGPVAPPAVNQEQKPKDVRAAVRGIPFVQSKTDETEPGRPVLCVYSHSRSLSDNHLEQLRPALEACLEPVFLDLSQCHRVTDAGMVHLKNLACLRRLDLFDTKIGDAGLEHLTGLTNLENLRLGTHNLPAVITDAGLAHVAKITSLRKLYLNCPKVTDDGLARLAPLTNLEEFTFAGNLLEPDVGDRRLAAMKGMTKLRALTVGSYIPKGNDPLTDAGMAYLKNFTELRHLDLAATQTKVTAAGFANLAGLTKLERLQLRYCMALRGDAVAALKDMTNLKYLQFERCDNLDDDGLQYLKGLVNVETLHLGLNQVTDAGLAHLSGMTRLQVIYLGPQTRITPRGKTALQKALPKVRFDRGTG
jgi:Leucine-rich repeat (LRR) protein